MPPRFDHPSLRDAAALLWGMAGVVLLGLGRWLWEAGDDGLDWQTEEDQE